MSAEVTGAGESSSKVAFSATSDDEAAVDMDRGTAEERMGLMDENKVPEFISDSKYQYNYVWNMPPTFIVHVRWGRECHSRR